MLLVGTGVVELAQVLVVPGVKVGCVDTVGTVGAEVNDDNSGLAVLWRRGLALSSGRAVVLVSTGDLVGDESVLAGVSSGTGGVKSVQTIGSDSSDVVVANSVARWVVARAGRRALALSGLSVVEESSGTLLDGWRLLVVACVVGSTIVVGGVDSVGSSGTDVVCYNSLATTWYT